MSTPLTAKEKAEARRAKILAGGSNRLQVAKGEKASLREDELASPGGEDAPTSPTAAVAAVETYAVTSEHVAPAILDQAPLTPDTVSRRPLAARRNLVKTAAATTVSDAPSVVNDAEGKDEEDLDYVAPASALLSATSSSLFPSFSSLSSAPSSSSGPSSSPSTPSASSSSSSRRAHDDKQDDAPSSGAGSRPTTDAGSDAPAPIISPSIRQVEQEIAKITVESAAAVETDAKSSAKKSSRPLAERRNRIKGGASPASAVAENVSASAIVENNEQVNAALAKAGFVPLQQAAIMKLVRLVAIVVVAVMMGYRSFISSAPIIESSEIFADAPAISPIMELWTILAGMIRRRGTSDVRDESRTRLRAYLGQKFDIMSTSSGAVAANAALSASSLGITINGSILETSIFTIVAVWFVSGMFSQYITTKVFQNSANPNREWNVILTPPPPTPPISSSACPS